MRARNLVLNTAILGALTVLLLIPVAGTSIHLDVGGPTLAVGPSMGPTSHMPLLAAGRDDPPPHGRADDPPPHG